MTTRTKCKEKWAAHVTNVQQVSLCEPVVWTGTEQQNWLQGFSKLKPDHAKYNMLWPNQNICQDQDLPANHFAWHVIHSWPNQQPCLVDRSQSVFYFVPQENRRLWISQSSRLDYCLVEFSTYYTLLGQMLSFVVKSAAALLSCLLFAVCTNPDKGDAVPSLALDISLLDIFMAPLERNAELNSKCFMCRTNFHPLEMTAISNNVSVYFVFNSICPK